MRCKGTTVGGCLARSGRTVARIVLVGFLARIGRFISAVGRLVLAVLVRQSVPCGFEEALVLVGVIGRGSRLAVLRRLGSGSGRCSR